MKKLISKRQVFGCLAILIILLWAWHNFSTTGLKVSKETTYYTSPLTPNGKCVNYLAVYQKLTYPDEIATDNNGLRYFIENVDVVTGKLLDRHSDLLAQYLKDVGLPTVYKKPNVKFVEFFEDEVGKRRIINFDLFPNLINLDNLEMDSKISEDITTIEKWLPKASPGLDILVEASRKPVFFLPNYKSSGDDEVAYVGNFISYGEQIVSEWLCNLLVRACYRYHKEDFIGAASDAIAVKRIVRNNFRGAFNTVRGGNRKEEIADAILEQLVNKNKLLEEEIEKLRTEIVSLPPRIPFEKMFMCERVIYLSLLTQLAHKKNNISKNPLELTESSQDDSLCGVDWNIFC
ncbi:MAG: hypothetical protein ACRC2T_09935, partial [Thermoguttaceae bacterium]